MKQLEELAQEEATLRTRLSKIESPRETLDNIFRSMTTLSEGARNEIAAIMRRDLGLGGVSTVEKFTHGGNRFDWSIPITVTVEGAERKFTNVESLSDYFGYAGSQSLKTWIRRHPDTPVQVWVDDMANKRGWFVNHRKQLAAKQAAKTEV